MKIKHIIRDVINSLYEGISIMKGIRNNDGPRDLVSITATEFNSAYKDWQLKSTKIIKELNMSHRTKHRNSSFQSFNTFL